MEIFKEFRFDAAHNMPDMPPIPGASGERIGAAHKYTRPHGHSFRARIVLRGVPDPKSGWVMDFADLEDALSPLRDQLDHNYLNDIDGLSVPTLENICQWLWAGLSPAVPGLHRVELYRDSCAEGCVYEGEQHA